MIKNDSVANKGEFEEDDLKKQMTVLFSSTSNIKYNTTKSVLVIIKKYVCFETNKLSWSGMCYEYENERYRTINCNAHGCIHIIARLLVFQAFSFLT